MLNVAKPSRIHTWQPATSKWLKRPFRARRIFFLVPPALLMAACMGQNTPTTVPATVLMTEAPGGQPASTQSRSVPPSATPAPTLAAVASATPTFTPASPTLSETASPTAVTPAATAQPAATEAPLPTAAGSQGSAAGECANLASFVADVTIPDDTLVDQGAQLVKTWRLYNAGTCTWAPQYALVLAGGDAMGAPSSNSLPETGPGTMVDLSLNLTAPQQGGPAYGEWLLQDAQGDRFGIGLPSSGPIWVRINVKYLSQNAELPSLPVSTTQTINQSGCAFQRNPGYESQILGFINQQRQNNGLDPLTPNVALSNAALFYSTDMACNNRTDFSRHTDSQGNRWYQRINAQGYSYSTALENVYVGNPTYGGPDGTPQGAITWWMNSPIHRDTLLNPDVTQIGIGYVFVADSDYAGYYTTDFASP